MNIGIISIDRNVMISSLAFGLRELGHRAEWFRLGFEYDLVIIDNIVAHGIENYSWTMLDNIITDRIALVDAGEYGWWTRVPSVAMNYATLFAPGAIEARPDCQGKLREFLAGKSYPYFLREMSRYLQYPSNYHPIDYPIHWSRLDITHRPPSSIDHFRARFMGICCIWGHSHPARKHIHSILAAMDGNHYISPHKVLTDQYYDYLQSSKVGISFDGYGSGSFRETEVLLRCCLVRGRLDVHRPNPLTPGVNCFEYDFYFANPYDDLETYETNVETVVRSALDDVAKSYEIYLAGREHCIKHYSPKGMAEYMMGIIDNHDYSIATEPHPSR